MSTINYNAIITDKKETENLENSFIKNNEKLSKKVYNSVLEERLRTNKLVLTKKIKLPVETVFKSVVEAAAKDLHASLTYDDLAVNTFYRTSKKSHKIPFKITEFETNKKLTFEYYANDQHFTKTFIFKDINHHQATKIIYVDIVVGSVSISGWFEKHVRNLYIKRQVIAFKIQMLNTQLDLEIIPKKKINQTQKKINKLIKYSNDII